MTIKETTIGKSRFLRRPIENSRIIDKPEVAYHMGLDYKVEVTPPDTIFYGMRKRAFATVVARELVGNEINQNEASLTFSNFRLPFGFVKVTYGYVREEDPVVTATNERLHDRSVDDLGEIVTLMELDETYAQDPLDLIASGVPPEGQEGEADFVIPEDLREPEA
jgi:hypothetical protein